MAPIDFLLARLADDEHMARATAEAGGVQTPFNLIPPGPFDPARVLAQVAALRAVVELHQSWPLLVEGPLEFGQAAASDIDSIAYRASRQIQWLTQQEYVARFGTEPPTAPIIVALCQPFADHPDFDPAWRSPTHA